MPMLGKRSLLLIAILLLATPLAGCFGKDAPAADVSGETNNTTAGGDPLPDDEELPDVTPTVPTPLNETVPLTVKAKLPQGPENSTAATSGSVAEGATGCEVVITWKSGSIGPGMSIAFNVKDAAGSVLGSGNMGNPTPPANPAPVTIACSAPAAGPVTVEAVPSNTVQDVAVDAQVSITY